MGKKARRLFVSAAVAAAFAVPGNAVLADPPPCEPGAPGCKTVDDPDKNNPKFTCTQRGRVGAPGTSETLEGANNGQTKQCDRDY